MKPSSRRRAVAVAVAAALVGVCRPLVTYPPGGWGGGKVVESQISNEVVFYAFGSNATFPKLEFFLFGVFFFVFRFDLGMILRDFEFPDSITFHK